MQRSFAALAAGYVALGVTALSCGAVRAQSAPPQSSDDPCGMAEAWAANGFLEDARMAYGRLSSSSDTARCARDGLAALASAALERELETGRRYALVGDLDEALEAYRRALELGGPRFAERVQRRIGKIERMKIDALTGVGRYSEALSLAAESPNLLEAVTADSPGLRWQRRRAVLGAWGITVAEAVAVLAVLTFAGLFLLRRFGKPGLAIEPFGADGLQTKIGEAFADALQGALTQLGEGKAQSLDLRVDQPLYAQSIPAQLVQALPQSVSWAQAVPALLGSVVARRTIRVSGALHGAQRAGATLRVVTGSRVIASDTLWAALQNTGAAAATDPSKDGAFFELARYAAIWILFVLRADDPTCRPLGTRDWRAYVSFLKGVHAESRDKETARAHYVQALQYDSALHAARYNLALLAPRAAYRATIADLQRATQADITQDPLTHYQAKYTLAARLFVIGRSEEAEAIAGELVQEIARDKAPDKKIDDRLRSYLTYEEPIARSLYVGLWTKNHQKLTKLDEMRELRAAAATPRTHFNVACAFSLAAGVAKSAQSDKTLDLLDCSLQSLEAAFLMMPKLAGGVTRNAALEEVRTSRECLRGRTVAEHFEALRRGYAHSAPKPAKLPLADLESIGPVRAAKLQENGVVSADDLIRRSATPAQRKSLAEDLDVGERSLLRWASTAELLKIVGIGVREANLLNDADVHSLAELAAQHAPALTLVLRDCAKTAGLESSPTWDETREWIADAAARASKLQV